MALRNPRIVPPGGWIYTQKETGWKLTSMNPISEAVSMLVNHRIDNHLPRATNAEAQGDIEDATCERLGYDTNYCVSSVKKNSSPIIRLFKSSAAHVHHAVKTIGERSEASGALFDWLGKGGTPVNSSLAQNRADVCTGRLSGNRCPYNKPGFKPIESVAEFVRRQIEKKHELNLSVEAEQNLETCDQCWCHLPLKVWCPIDHMKENTPQPMLEKIKSNAPYCWIPKEIYE